MNNWQYSNLDHTLIHKIFEDGHYECKPAIDVQLSEGEVIDAYVEHIRSYTELRVSEYPPMADYLDGLVKGDQAQMQAYIDACLAVKAKYPKPV